MKPKRFRIPRLLWYTARYWWLTLLIAYEWRRYHGMRIRRWGDLHCERGRAGMIVDWMRGMPL